MTSLCYSEPKLMHLQDDILPNEWKSSNKEKKKEKALLFNLPYK